jgi:hypothetical protein
MMKETWLRNESKVLDLSKGASPCDNKRLCWDGLCMRDRWGPVRRTKGARVFCRVELRKKNQFALDKFREKYIITIRQYIHTRSRPNDRSITTE